jgi:hypothetical protein
MGLRSMEPLRKKTKKKLESFYYSAIRRILNIRWDQVRIEKIGNKQVRFHFCNIQKIESYINKRTAAYIDKIARARDDELQKKTPWSLNAAAKKNRWTVALM